ncbi:DNA methyltransferase [Paludisphaera mucosa]|uniref:DNA methyltransferase n=1 Tax=Paludisphaera mucosa TaxID=3030827 RepID=A0ABT6FBA5_9BACT|nr:DNA methyltransferase [Paludisphaera mucosa]MDG3004829.1 DNA methyltransferase [Paludisphaera mucosa]
MASPARRAARPGPAPSETPAPPPYAPLDVRSLDRNLFSLEVYGDSADQVDDLIESVREHGILEPLVVAPGLARGRWEVVSGHRRLACAAELALERVPCVIREFATDDDRRTAVLEYNRQRRKTFSQMMREADALETLLSTDARARSRGNLRNQDGAGVPTSPSPRTIPFGDHPSWNDDEKDAGRRNSDARSDEGQGGAVRPRPGRTDAAVAERIGLGGKDLYRQARAVWAKAREGDPRALAGVAQLDAETKTIHAAYKDLRRRDKFSRDFRPTPYDVWSFRHDRAFGVPHPGSIPPSLVAHALHYFTDPGALVVDPMAGGGTTLDVALAMGRRCLAYDLEPVRTEIAPLDVRLGFPPEAAGCDLVFCDPPYHTMLARKYPRESVAAAPLEAWTRFLDRLAQDVFLILRPGGAFALLLAPQTEKDLPRGHGYIDHVFLGYRAGLEAGFLPERRISCPMSGDYTPQQVRRARTEGRLLGQVRDLLVLRKPRESDLRAQITP